MSTYKLIIKEPNARVLAIINLIRATEEIELQEVKGNSDIIESIKTSLKEVKMHQEGKIKLKSAYDLLNEV